MDSFTLKKFKSFSHWCSWATLSWMTKSSKALTRRRFSNQLQLLQSMWYFPSSVTDGYLIVYSARMTALIGLRLVRCLNSSLTSGFSGVGFAPTISMANSRSSVPVSSEAVLKERSAFFVGALGTAPGWAATVTPPVVAPPTADYVTENLAADLDPRVP